MATTFGFERNCLIYFEPWTNYKPQISDRFEFQLKNRHVLKKKGLVLQAEGVYRATAEEAGSG